MKRREIIELLKSYKFDINEYIVLSGAAMVIHGLKDETNDIDISVTPEYYDYLLSHYDCEFEKINEFNHAVYYIENVINFGRDYYDTERTIIDGISVQTIENIIRLKQYLNREKDKHDLELIKSKTYKLLDSNGKQYLSTTKGALGGHKKLKIYGRLDCPSALKWLEKGYYKKNRVFFDSEQTAIEAGYRPCAVCMKKEYKLWKENIQK